MNTKVLKIIMAFIITICVVMAFALPFANDVAYAESFGGKEYSSLWYADDLKVAEVKQVISTWDLSKVTSPIVIACIDTGITQTHELFSGVLTRNGKGELLGYNSYAAIHGDTSQTVNIADESSFHGTKVAGIMAMLIRELGLQNYIKIYPIKANTPGKDSFSLASVVNAIDWAVSDNVKASVINMSLSAAGTGDTVIWKDSEDLQYAIEKATSSAVLVAAAGNNSSNSSVTAYYPAAHDGVIGVVGYGKDGAIYSTSNYGSAYDIAVPEREIYTATGASSYGDFQGTSASAPFVSVAAALLKLRFVVEGGTQNPTGIGIEQMLTHLLSKVITKGQDTYPTIDLHKVATQDFSNTDYHYLPPTGINVTGDGTLGTGDYHDTYVERADDIKPIEFLASIKPLGKTNPALDEAIEWYVREIKVGEAEDIVLSEKRVGNGEKYTFTAARGGDYEIEARINYAESTIKSFRRVHVEYQQYLAGEVRVTVQGHEGDYVADAPSTAAIYTNRNITLGLTGIEYVDQTVDIKWFVDGEEVKDGDSTYTGTHFKFVPKKAGTYVISAKYGDRAEISGSYTFTLVVKPTMSNPLYISLTCIGAVAIGAVIAIVVILVKKKSKVKATQEQ